MNASSTILRPRGSLRRSYRQMATRVFSSSCGAAPSSCCGSRGYGRPVPRSTYGATATAGITTAASTDATTDATTAALGRLTPSDIAAYARDGVVLLRGVLSPAELELAGRAVAGALRTPGPCAEFIGAETTWDSLFDEEGANERAERGDWVR